MHSLSMLLAPDIEKALSNTSYPNRIEFNDHMHLAMKASVIWSSTSRPYGVVLARDGSAMSEIPAFKVQRREGVTLRRYSYELDRVAISFRNIPRNLTTISNIGATPRAGQADGPRSLGTLSIIGQDLYSITLYRNGEPMEEVPTAREAVEATLEHRLPVTHVYRFEPFRPEDTRANQIDLLSSVLTYELVEADVFTNRAQVRAALAQQPLKEKYDVVSLTASNGDSEDIATCTHVDTLPEEPVWKRLTRIHNYRYMTGLIVVRETGHPREVHELPSVYLLAAPSYIYLNDITEIPHYAVAAVLHLTARMISRAIRHSAGYASRVHETIDPIACYMRMLEQASGGRR